MNYFLWGAGRIGKRFINHVGEENVVGYIDKNKDKIHTKIQGKPIITIEEYMRSYEECYIIVTTLRYEPIVSELNDKGIYKYFLCAECPGEWLDQDERIEFERYVYSKIEGKKNAVFGLNPYSLHIVSLITKKTGFFPDVIVEKEKDLNLISAISEEFPDSNFFRCDEIKSKYEKIYKCTQCEIAFDNKTDNIVDIWDCSYVIEQYHNPKIEKLKDMYHGERCFIVGLGPSLRKEDLDVLDENKERCFSVNTIYKIFGQTKWRPDFYVVSDTDYIDNFNEDISFVKDIKLLFVGDQTKSDIIDSNRLSCNQELYRYHINRTVRIDSKTGFSNDFSRNAYFGATVVYICMQLAVYMGFKKIVLLGVDFSGGMSNSGKHYGHFYKEEKLESTFFGEIVQSAYLAAKTYTESHNIRIVNASRGGKLEIFDRVDFDELFLKK